MKKIARKARKRLREEELKKWDKRKKREIKEEELRKWDKRKKRGKGWKGECVIRQKIDGDEGNKMSEEECRYVKFVPYRFQGRELKIKKLTALDQLDFDTISHLLESELIGRIADIEELMAISSNVAIVYLTLYEEEGVRYFKRAQDVLDNLNLEEIADIIVIYNREWMGDE